MAEPGCILVSVVYSPRARCVREWCLSVAEGSSLLQAVQACGLSNEFPALDLQTARFGLWGRKAALSQTLRDQDRVEIYRALNVDPKIARRERFVKQGARSAGLFSKKRPGSKAGY